MSRRVIKLLEPSFNEFCAPLIGLTINNIWQGYGSAIFLEFGRLEIRPRRDGSPGNPRGEWGLMVEWGWRIEGKRRIWCGVGAIERAGQKLYHDCCIPRSHQSP